MSTIANFYKDVPHYVDLELMEPMEKPVAGTFPYIVGHALAKEYFHRDTKEYE